MDILEKKLANIIDDLDTIKLDAKASVDNTIVLGDRLNNITDEITKLKNTQVDIFKILVRISHKSGVNIKDIFDGQV
ncbi:MAG: hypothetical protein V4538_09070 [Bacteroidota bacterium]